MGTSRLDSWSRDGGLSRDLPDRPHKFARGMSSRHFRRTQLMIGCLELALSETTTVCRTNGTYFSVPRLAIRRLISARGRVSQS
jgi:hypothetical protein